MLEVVAHPKKAQDVPAGVRAPLAKLNRLSCRQPSVWLRARLDARLHVYVSVGQKRKRGPPFEANLFFKKNKKEEEYKQTPAVD